MATEQQRKKAAAQTGVYLVVVVAIAVMANVLSAGAYKRFDWTRNERYTLSTGSGRLIKSLKAPVQADVYITRGLAQTDAFIRDMTDLLKEYERAGGANFKYTLIEAKTDELKERAKEAGLEEMAFGEASATGGDQASIAQGYLGIVLKYGSEKGVMPLNPGQASGLEFWITNKIREIRDKADNIKHKVGIVTGKDELKLSDQNLVPKQGQGGASIQSILSRAFPFYEIVDVDLKDGEAEIDKALDGLIVTQPQKAYTDKELRRIDQFVMLGNKSLAVFASAVSLKPNDPAMSATLDTHNIEKLISGYGINMKKDAILDPGSSFRIQVLLPTGGLGFLRHPGIAHVVNDPGQDEKTRYIDTGFAGFFRMDELLFPFPSSLEILRDKQPSDVKLQVLARTTAGASAVTEGTVDMKMKTKWEAKPPYEQRVIAAVADGKLKSAFAGQGEDLGVTAPERSAQPSRVLVISSSEFLTNPFAYSGNGPDLGQQFAMFGGAGGDRELLMIAGQYAQRYLTPTILSVKNTLDWISGDADLLAVSAKLVSNANLVYRDVDKPKITNEDDEAAIRKKDEEYKGRRAKLQSSVQWTLMLGVPLFFGLFGLFRWRERNNRRDSYKL